jgi:hypothetical protein
MGLEIILVVARSSFWMKPQFFAPLAVHEHSMDDRSESSTALK